MRLQYSVLLAILVAALSSPADGFAAVHIQTEFTPKSVTVNSELQIQSEWEQLGSPGQVDFVEARLLRSSDSQSEASPATVIRLIESDQGSSLFQANVELVELPGRYQVAVRAVSEEALSEDMAWINVGELVVRSKVLGAEKYCVGDRLVPIIKTDSSVNISISAPEIVSEDTVHVISVEDYSQDLRYAWCASRGLFLNADQGSVEYLAPHTPGLDQTAKIQIYSAGADGSLGFGETAISLMDNGDLNESDPEPFVGLAPPADIKLGEQHTIYFSLRDLDELNADRTSDLVSDIYLSVDNGASFQLLLSGLRGNGAGPGPYFYVNSRETNERQHSASYSWVATEVCQNCRLKIVSTDGFSIVEKISPPFEIRGLEEHLLSGFTSSQDGNPLEGVAIFIGGDILTHSDDAGHYSGTVDSAGTVIVSARLAGFQFEPAEVEVTLNSGGSSQGIDFIGYEVATADYSIDIKPGSDTNPINPRSRGKIPVAILSDADFNATTDIVRTSLTFGSTGDEESLHYRGNGEPNCGEEDVNADGLLDLVCHFYTQTANFQADNTEGILRGQTTEGEDFEARDGIRIVGNGGGPDNDADGVDDDTENAGPNNGDANNDGLLDSAQTNVTALLSSSGNYLALVSSPDCTNTAVSAVDPSELPTDTSGLEAPEGFLSFTLTTCNSSDTTVFFHGRDDLSSADYRRYGPTAEKPSDHWYSLPATFRSVVIDGELVATANFQLVDGGLGDDDLSFNGEIVDPGGPAVRGTGVTDIPSASTWSLLLLAIFLGSGAIYLISRRH